MSINLSALMKQRYDTAANWTAQNPTLLAGEIGIESDTKKWKVGTGATAWTSLVYAIGGTYPIVNADIAAAAAIVDTKLATIATAGKVSNSATTAASANTASAIVARDASGNFTAGTITAALTGAASSNVLKAGDTMTGPLVTPAGTVTANGIQVGTGTTYKPGIYSPGADQLAISTSGTGRIIVDASGNVNIDSNTVYVDAVNNRVGIGTTPAAGSLLHINSAASTDCKQQISVTTSTQAAYTAYVSTVVSTVGTENSTGGSLVSGSGPYATVISNGGAYPINFGTNNTLRATIDSSGRLLVGTSTARANFFNSATAPQFQIEGTGLGTTTASVTRCSADAFGPIITLGKSRNASVGGNTIVNSGDECGTLDFQGNDGTEFVSLATITGAVDGTPGANDMPGRLVFSTTADGASSPTERIRIRADGATVFYNTSLVFPNTDNAVQLGGNTNRMTALFAVNGTIQTSDGREKVAIIDSELGSNFIKSLRPVSYKWIEGGKQATGERDEEGNNIYESVPGRRTHWGFIAQEVKEVVDAAGVDFGGWVLTEKDNPESRQALRYDQFIAPLTKALQEALERIETLEASNADMLARVTALETA